MARTGESYQEARHRLLAQSSSSTQACSGFDVLELDYLGKPAALASWHSYGVPIAIFLSEAVGRPLVLPRFAMASASAIRFTAGVRK
jgi:hypothetical protein